MEHSAQPFVVIGDINVDLSMAIAGWPHEGGDVLADGVTWSNGGTGLNCAVAAARMGFSVALFARVGSDPAAAQVLACARAAGVDTSGIQTDATVPTGLCVIPVTPHGERTFLSYRGANVQWQYGHQCSGSAGWLHVCGHALLADPQRASALLALQHAQSLGWHTSIDLCDPLAPHAAALISQLAAPLTVVLGNERELQMAQLSAPSHAGSIVTKRGAHGATVHGATNAVAPGIPVDAVDTTACGDAFGVVFCASRAGGADTASALLVANATGAITASRRGAADVVPTRANLIRFLQIRALPVPAWLSAT